MEEYQWVMTRTQALKEARSRWGRRAFVGRQRNADPKMRHVVGISTVNGEPLALGMGRTFEAAFAMAESMGFSREKILQAITNAEKAGKTE